MFILARESLLQGISSTCNLENLSLGEGVSSGKKWNECLYIPRFYWESQRSSGRNVMIHQVEVVHLHVAIVY